MEGDLTIPLPVIPIPLTVQGRVLGVLTLTISAVLRLDVPPPVQSVTELQFTKGPGDTMTARPVLSPANPADNVTSRPVQVVVANAAPVVLDMIDPNASVACNPGDSVTVTPQGDVNAAGAGPAGPAFTKTAPPAGGGGGGGGAAVPGIQNVTDINFV